MSLAESLKPTLYSARSIAGQLGFRPHTVSLLIRASSGAHTGDGSVTDTETAITEAGGQPPHVRWLKDDEIALGQLPVGAIEIGPITPAFSGGGTDLTDLQGADLSAGDVRLVRVTGPKHPSGADYRITALKADKALRYMITAIPVSAGG